MWNWDDFHICIPNIQFIENDGRDFEHWDCGYFMGISCSSKDAVGRPQYVYISLRTHVSIADDGLYKATWHIQCTSGYFASLSSAFFNIKFISFRTSSGKGWGCKLFFIKLYSSSARAYKFFLPSEFHISHSLWINNLGLNASRQCSKVWLNSRKWPPGSFLKISFHAKVSSSTFTPLLTRLKIPIRLLSTNN